MELLYVWIDNYKNIKNQGFNFSPKYQFTYNHNTHVLEFEKKEEVDLPPNFWGKNVMNLTLLLGKNGAGKSSVLEVCFMDSSLKAFYVFSDSSLLTVVKHPELEVKSKIKVEDYPKLSYSLENIDTWYLDDKFDNRKASIIYYNPIINGKSYYNDILKKDKNKGYKFKLLNDISLENGLVETQYTEYNFRNFNYGDVSFRLLMEQLAKEQLEFLSNPNYTNIKEKLFSNSNKYIKLRSINDFNIFEYKKSTENSPQENTAYNQFTKNDSHNRFISYMLFQYLIKQTKVLFYDRKGTPFLRPKEYETFKEKIITKLEESEKIDPIAFYEFLRDDFNHDNKKFFNDLKSHEEVTNLLKKILEISDIELDEVSISFKGNSFEQFFLFYHKLTVEEKAIMQSLFRFYFPGFSTGQLYLLSLFSRFNSLDTSELTPNIHIFIDEGETTLHPHWQKQYIKWLVEYVPMMFLDKTIQFIITSNNPIIASDVPSSNIIRLKTNEDGLCKIAETPTKTFGANIYDLLKDSFFIEDGFIGDFAKKKINDVLKWLNASDRELSQKQDVLQIIESIGEPILSQKLLEKYEEVTGQNAKLLKIQKKIKELQVEEANLLNSAKK